MVTRQSGSKTAKVLTVSLILCLAAVYALAAPQDELSTGETVYVSIYSHVYSGPRKLRYELSSMLSIRNTDTKHSIKILCADYYDSSGKKVEGYIRKPLVLTPLASEHIYINQYDTTGGEGANFIVKWRSDSKVNQPIIEGLMLGLSHGQGVSFTAPGKIISEHQD